MVNSFNIRVISAGAGSGKTYKLTQELVTILSAQGNKKVKASGIFATTFTKKAALELQERVRKSLLENGLNEEAESLNNSLIGTIHSLGVKLLKRFSFEAGVSPNVDVLPEEDQQIMFNNSLANLLSNEKVQRIEQLAKRLSIPEEYDWRKDIQSISDQARSNKFDAAAWENSNSSSISSLFELLPPKSADSAQQWNSKLASLVDAVIPQLEGGEDTTKATKQIEDYLKSVRNELHLQGAVPWYAWAKISKFKPGKKSREICEELIEYSKTHLAHPDFRTDIEEFISEIFNLAESAVKEFKTFKDNRGYLDYTDMEVMVLDLLDNETVQQVLKEELEILIVDEFQDTNPIQLSIYLKMARLASHSIWVGDPKQSIYAFRGGDPALMISIIDQLGGVKKENILPYSWRSRTDLVHLVNSIFVSAFKQLPEEQITLSPQRTFEKENQQLNTANIHWHFETVNGKKPKKELQANFVAQKIKSLLDQDQIYFEDKQTGEIKLLQAGDIAILCRSNKSCGIVAQELSKLGIQSDIGGAGLLKLPEIRLVLACLNLLVNADDDLSKAEIVALTFELELKEIIDSRLSFLEDAQDKKKKGWLNKNQLIKRLLNFQKEIKELSPSEILELLLQEIELNKLLAIWGEPLTNRLSNIDTLRTFVNEYESSCGRLHMGASLSGWLAWLNRKARLNADSVESVKSPDAIQVLTYHKSKGLEWPLVICLELDKSSIDRTWGLQVIQNENEVDLENPLQNRWVKYWVNPYGGQEKNTDLRNLILQSDYQQKAKLKSKEEESRLLYVGLTRARDYLVLPTFVKTPTHWLNSVCHPDQPEVPALLPGDGGADFVWKGELIPIQKEEMEFDWEELKSESTTEAARIIKVQRKSNKEINRDQKVEILCQFGNQHSYRAEINLDFQLSDHSLLGQLFDLGKSKNPGIIDHLSEDFKSLNQIEDLIQGTKDFSNYFSNHYGIVNFQIDVPFELRIKDKIEVFSVAYIAMHQKIFVFDCLCFKKGQLIPKSSLSIVNYAAALERYFGEDCHFYLHDIVAGQIISFKIENKSKQLNLL